MTLLGKPQTKIILVTAQKMKFSIKDFFGKCDQILNGKFHFLCSEKLSQESLNDRRWLRQIPYLYKIISAKTISLFVEIVPPLKRPYHYPDYSQTLRCRTALFQHLFLPFMITE